MEQKDTGILLIDQNIKLHRTWFKQMTQLVGINVLYRAPKEEYIKYNRYGEIESRITDLQTNYKQPIRVGCIFDEHPTQKTMRQLGWNAEMADTLTLLHMPYDVEGLQAGGLVTIPAGLDNAEPRLFRILRMSNIAIYPASITCELGPVLIDTLPKEKVEDFENSNFNLLGDESAEYNH